ncbi:unnamed protein product [Allacma fusca]|uniref:Ionotropic glutamate receptor C-terminal domain-containing protein n=1 Tax=Allacma fusca TaxID=39272 RepID=A0A8J2NRC4_9HEXA|nr:unnamed protein product [Allacma fusca]
MDKRSAGISIFLLTCYFVIRPAQSLVYESKKYIQQTLKDNNLQNCVKIYITLADTNSLPTTPELSNQLSPTTISRDDTNSEIYYSMNFESSTTLEDLKLMNSNLKSFFLGANRRHESNCAVIFLSAEFLQPSSVNQIMSQVLSQTNAIISVEQHLFVFTSKTREISTGLLLSDFSQNIKRKIFIVTNKNLVDFYMLCHYCNLGSPQIIKISEKSITSKVFLAAATNFNGKIFRVAAPRIVPRIELKKTDNGKFIPVRGVYKTVYHHLMKKYNFTYEIFPSSGGGTGLRLPNGTWIGAVGDIVNGLADFGLVSTTTYERRSLIDLAFPVEYEFLTFTLERQKRTLTWKSILWSFTSTMWLLICLSIKLSILVLLLLMKVSRKSNVRKKWEFAWPITYITGTLVDQNVRGPRSNSARLFVPCWLFFALIISTLYRSKLLSLLGFPVIEPVPETFKELSNSNYHYGLQYLGGAAFNTFKTSENGIYKTIFNKMSIEKNPVACIQKTKNNKFSCIGYHGFAEWIVNQHMSDRYGRHSLIVSSTSSFFIPVGIIMKKYATYLQEFNAFIQPAVESGLVPEWFKQDFSSVRTRRLISEKEKNTTTVFQDEESVTALKIQQFAGAYVALALGVILATISFSVEFRSRFPLGLLQSRMGPLTVDLHNLLSSNSPPTHSILTTRPRLIVTWG